MKTLLTAAFVLAFLQGASGQSIGNADFRSDGYVKVFDEKNRQIASGYVGGSNDEFDFSECMVVCRRRDGYVKIFDEKLRQIASGYAGGKDDSFKAVGCNLVVKRKDGYKKTFDKNLRQISSGY